MRDPLTPRPHPSWKTDLTSAQFGRIAEDLLAVALAAAGSGSATVAWPRVDRGVDLYLRRLRTLLTVPIQVKAYRHVDPDGTITQDIATRDIGTHTTGYWAMVHVPPPHDQLYRRLYLIPVEELRQRCPLVNSHGVDSYRFSANFADTTQGSWSAFAVDLEQLSDWIAAIGGWSKPIPPIAAAATVDALTVSDDLGTVGMAGLVAEDRTRLDTVTLLLHHLGSGRFAGLHLRTAILDEKRRTHFEVKRPHFFIDPGLWVALVLLGADLRTQDFCLLIPSADIAELGYSESVTLDPITKRFRKYQIPSDDFGSVFIDKAFGADVSDSFLDRAIDLRMAG